MAPRTSSSTKAVPATSSTKTSDATMNPNIKNTTWRSCIDSVTDRLSRISSSSTDGSIIGTAIDAFGASTVEELAELVREEVDRLCEASSAALLDDTVPAAEKSRISRALSALYYLQQAVTTSVTTSRAMLALGNMTIDSDVQSKSKSNSASKSKSKSSSSKDDVLEDEDDDIKAGIARFSGVDEDETNRVQQLLLYLLNRAQSRGYKRLNGECYRKRYTADGYWTHSYIRDMTIEDFVYSSTRKETNFDMWSNMTHVRGNVGTVCEYLSKCHDVQFPPLVKDRHVFSFKNGLYDARNDSFYEYGSEDMPVDVSAAKYFDVELSESDIADPQTPNLQRILDYQDMDKETCYWMYVMLGRLMYEVGELDSWQVIPYIKGMASSGKSTILTRVCRNFYEPEDVGTLSNNIERKFGLSALYDKFLFVAPEIKGDMQLEQAEFQSMVSGEALQVAIKFQTAQTVDWKVPGIMAGNEVPGWVDNGGSINRRILLFVFNNKVTNGDMDLGKKLEKELPALIVKCNRTYRDAVKKYARDNIWVHLPASFQKAKEELCESVSSIASFVRSDRVVLSRTACMPLTLFIENYLSYCTEMCLKKMKVSKPEIRSHLQSLDLALTPNRVTKPYWKSANSRGVTTDVFVLGMDLARPEENDDDVPRAGTPDALSPGVPVF